MNVAAIDNDWILAEMERAEKLADICHIAGYSQAVTIHTATRNALKRELDKRTLAVPGVK